MADLYEDYGLEVETDGFGGDPDLMPKKTTVVKKGGALGRVVALLLGFVLGVGGTVGGVVGAGYLVATQPVKDTLDQINGLLDPDIDFSQYISDEYADKKIKDLVGDVAGVVSKFANKTGCLNDLVAISPYVSTAIDPLLKMVADYGLELNKEDLMATPVGQLPAYLGEEAKSIKLPDILNKLNVAQSNILDAICYKENGDAMTVGDIMDDPDGLLSNIPLEALLIHESGVVNPDSDTLIMALSYGNQNRYNVGTEDSKVYMNQMTFTQKDGKLYDIDGNEVTKAPENGADTLEVGGKTVYLKASATAANTYLAYEDAACQVPANYKKVMVGDLMGGEATEVFNNLELGSLFNVSPLKDGCDPITLALAYGEEGTHYNIEGEGENRKIVWIGDNKPRTIGTLIGGDLTSIMNDIQLGTVLGISPLQNFDEDETNDPDAIMLTLAFGEEGTHYDIVQENGEYVISWRDDNKPRTIGYLTENASTIMNDIQLGTVLGISPLQNFDEDETNDPDSLMLALAYGYEGTHYRLLDSETDEDTLPDTIDWLDGNKPKTIASLTEGNAFDELRLATVLNADIYADPSDPNVDAITHALAFGYEGTHYEISDKDENNDGHKDIVWKEKPADPTKPDVVEKYDYRTVGNMEDMSEIIDTLRLGTVLSVDPLTEGADEMTLALAYGYEGTHYNIINGEISWIGDNAPRTVADMQDMGEILDEIRIETALSVTHESPRLLHVLAYGSEGTDYKYAKDADGKITGIYDITNYNTIKDLSSSEEDGLINSLKLKDLLGEDSIKDDMLLSHLGEETLNSLPDAVGNLTFKKVYPRQIYQNEYAAYEGATRIPLNFEETVNGNVYYTRKEDGSNDTLYQGSGTIVFEYKYDYMALPKVDGEGNPVKDTNGDQVYEKVNSIQPGWIDENDIYYNDTTHFYHYKDEESGIDYQVHLALTSQWKYLLTEEDHQAHDYPLTDFAKLVTNMTNNMTTATLYDLNTDGIIKLDSDTLTTKVLNDIDGDGVTDITIPNATPRDEETGLVLGDLTVTQIMSYTAAVLREVNELVEELKNLQGLL